MRYLLMCLLVFTLPLNAGELSRYVAVKVHKAFQAQQSGQLNEAISVLQQIESKKDYDIAYVQRLLGVFYWQVEYLEQAEKALVTSVALNELEPTQQLDTQRMLAEIQLYQQKFVAAVTNYLAVIESTQEREKLAGYWFRVAQAYYALERWQEVLDAVASYKSYVDTPKVAILTIQLGAQLALEQWNSAITTVKQLRDLEPEQQRWWQQLYGLLLHTSQNQEALATLAQMERAGFTLTQPEIKILANLYANQGIPAKAAKQYGRLEKLDRDTELLATQARYWQRAREWGNALESWEKAADLDKEHRWPYAQLLLKQEKYQMALEQLNSIANPSEQILLAKVQAYYRLSQPKMAKKMATLAYRLSQSKAAREWLDYLERVAD